MRYRELGRTGMSVSEIGYGAWGLGSREWKTTSPRNASAALERALDRGITFVDTARLYGDSETLVGRAVRARQGSGIRVATKVPPLGGAFPPAPGTSVDEVFPAAHIRAGCEDSLRATGLDHIDLLQLHTWDDAWLGDGDWLGAVGVLKDAGKIRSFGVSVNSYQPESVTALVQSGLVDAIQLIYNVFHQAPAEHLLPLCRRHGVGVVVRVALDEGGLTGRIHSGSTFPEGDFRNVYFGSGRAAQVGERVRALCADLRIGPDDLPALALRFVLDHPAVSTVVVGTGSPANVERNVTAAEAGPLSDLQREKLRGHRWERNFYRPA